MNKAIMKYLALLLLVFTCLKGTQGVAQNTIKIESVEVERLYIKSDSSTDFYNYKIKCKSADTIFYMNYKSQKPLRNHKNAIMFFLTERGCLIEEGKKYLFKLEKVCGSELKDSFYNYFAVFNDSLDCSVFENKRIIMDQYRNKFIFSYHSIVEIDNKIYRVIIDLKECYCKIHSDYYR